MAISQTEIDDAIELFACLGPIRTRKMMGGLTIYAQDVTFAIYDPVQGYFLKSDGQTQPLYEAEGLERFTFEMKGKTASMNYYALPEDAYDDPDVLELWARRALDVALRAKKPKKKKKA